MASPHTRAATINLRVLTDGEGIPETIGARDGTGYAGPVGLKKLVRGLNVSVDDLEHERLSTRFQTVKLGSADLGDCPLRCPVRVVGEVTSLRVVPRSGSPSLEATVDDGTGSAVAVFTGRRAIRGLDPGRGVILDGVVRRERSRLTLVNPAYTLLP